FRMSPQLTTFNFSMYYQYIINHISQFFSRIVSNSVKINANYLDLLSSAAIKWPSPNLILSPMPTIPISNFISSAIFEASETTNELNQISLSNSLQNSFNFYTDGSVIDIGTNNCTMGISWVQVDSNELIVHKFSAKIHLWPSSYKAELFSILAAISTTPRNSTINIYTDS